MTSGLLDKKFEYWKHQLLDLGKRNKMINYRETKRTTVKLVEPSFDDLYSRLAVNEETLTFQRAIDRETDIRIFSLLSLLDSLSNPLQVTVGDIKTEGSVPERQYTLKNMRAKSRLALEEQGTNILYVSFGFIEWKDGKGASSQWIKSPLILVPAVLALEALNSPYTLKRREDDIVVNPTLEYYLKNEYGIELPQFDADKDSPDDFFEKLEVIADKRGWRIVKEVSLGLLSFLKISMYNDLIGNEQRIKESPVIRAMAGDSAEINDIPESLSSFNLDSIRTQDCFQVMSADSSQQDAILYSKNNISFVMQGPPGTGKSQTITNIIAEALAEGKKVLFVSEKMAALQVVYRRLQEAHLGDFCLPLHSYKANKKEILEQIGSNLKLKQTRVKDEAINSLEELLAVRQELNKYATELHALNAELNISCYEAYSKLENVIGAPSLLFILDNPLKTTQAQLQSYLNALHEYSLSLKRLDYFVDGNPWTGLVSHTSGFEYTEQMRTVLKSLTDSFNILKDALEAVSELSGLYKTVPYAIIPELCEQIVGICSLPRIPEKWVGEFDLTRGISTAEDAECSFRILFSLRESISEVFSKTICDFSCNEWRDNIIKRAEAVADLPLLDNCDSYYYVNEAHSLLSVFSALKSALNEAHIAYRSINSEFGTDFATSAAKHKIINALYNEIKTNVILNKNWFSADVGKIRSLVIQAKGVSAGITELKKKLLETWEQEVLSLDYKPILIRFKTEYTDVFKVFKAQYRKDKKQIQALSKTVIKKLSDDVAVDLLKTLKEYHESVEWFAGRSNELESALGMYYSGIETDWDEVIHALGITDNIKHLPIREIPTKLINLVSSDHSDEIAKLVNRLSIISTAFEKVRTLTETAGINISVDAADFDCDIILEIIDAYLSRLNEVSLQREILKPYLINENEQIEVIYKTIDLINKHSEEQKKTTALTEIYQDYFGDLFAGESTDWDYISNALHRLAELKKSDLFVYLTPLINISSDRKREIEKRASEIKDFNKLNGSSLDWFKSQFTDDSMPQSMTTELLRDKINGCLQNLDNLVKWIDYREAKEICTEAGLGDFVEKFESTCLCEDIDKVFLKGFYLMWLGAVCDRSASVRRFRRNAQDDKVKKFIELDDLQLGIAQMRIREKLIESLPSAHRLLKATDEVAILNKELSKKRNIMPLRKIFRMIPNLLMRLKPCLMMSPLSVSYFLETEAYHFDLVIFDEASQIFPEDAIGAIFRGCQVIIAGDSKQLPPTDFFTSTTNNYDGEYDIDGNEDYSEVISSSILDESASVLPNRTLLWHYRSKHESLIAFSNREIYKNNLITFPNCINNLPDMGVEYVYVEDGCYDRGGRKNNIREAEECVRLIFEHIKKHPDRSLGVIAFSESQQTTIENAIIDYREKNPAYEWFFDESRDEPFFVKNLENVQGDERDTIIFSICYGKDKNGTMYMNFGPVGHNGGERRLNVAITRAKCNIKLVGSILPSDIDLNRARTEGVRMLRAYIEYARKGASVLKPTDKIEAFNYEDEFCEVVAGFLKQNGYTIKRQVGCSDYKIDIAVVNPNAEGDYIAGIECDGLSYIHAKTARDRDHLRSSILRNMGWNLYRVWSTEWVRNPDAEGEALLSFLDSVYDKNGKVRHTVRQSNAAENDIPIESIAAETNDANHKNPYDNPYGFAYYEEASWQDTKHSDSHDNSTLIGENILHIVSVEQPIHMEILYRRMGASFTTGKATERVKSTIDGVIARTLQGRVTVDEEQFVRLLPITPITVRIPNINDTPRPIEYIHTKEVAEAMRVILASSYGITENDLASECAGVFGFERKGPKIRAKTDAAIKFLVDSKEIRIIDGKVQLIGE